MLMKNEWHTDEELKKFLDLQEALRSVLYRVLVNPIQMPWLMLIPMLVQQ